MLLNWTKNLLKKHNIKPSKRLGQNFLVDKEILQILIGAADIKNNDTIVEVGAGIGTITLELAKLAKKVIAVEKDGSLIPILHETVRDYKNIEIIQGDILKLSYNINPIPLRGISRRGITYKLVGNIPYYLTAPLIRKFLEADNPPKAIILMAQKEMAQRICASPPDMSILSVSVQVYAKPEIVGYVSRSAFWPQPAVDSAILRITKHESRVMNTKEERGKFFTLVRAGFSSPRKQLINNLSGGLNISREQTEQWLVSCGIAPERRAETLTVEEWTNLAKLSP